jgi:serpin B
MKSLLVFFALAVAFNFSSCNKDPEGPKQPKPITLTSKGHEVISATNDFGVNLFRVTSLEEDGNLMLSPLSASTALTMLLNGCNATTYEQIRKMLGFENLTLEEINAVYQSLVSQLLVADPEVKFSLANAVFYRNEFEVKPPYLEAMDQSFDAEIAALDFSAPSALETINGWASDHTNGKIPKVLEEINPLAVMFLMNALYFKGTWTVQFNTGNTHAGSFTKENGSVIDADMMSEHLPVRMFSDAEMSVVELSYGQGNFTMIILVPQGSLSDYLQDFGPEQWNSITTGFDAAGEPVEMDIYLPRFKFEYEKYLNDQLKALGMTDAFEADLADLSGISDASIYVDFVKQNTFIEVNEEGTEAAAVTTIGINYTGFEGFIADKPFLFAIREKTTNTLLFIGKVEEPNY